MSNNPTNPVVKPTAKRILVRPQEPKKTTDGGIFLPDSAVETEKPQQGVILDIGKDCENEYAIGDTVIFSKHAAIKFDVNGEKYLVVSDETVIAVIK